MVRALTLKWDDRCRSGLPSQETFCVGEACVLYLPPSGGDDVIGRDEGRDGPPCPIPHPSTRTQARPTLIQRRILLLLL